MSPIDDCDDEIQAALRRSLDPSSAVLTPAGSSGQTRSGSSPASKRSKSEEREALLAQQQQKLLQQQKSAMATASEQPLSLQEDDAARQRRIQREVRAAAAERRLQGMTGVSAAAVVSTQSLQKGMQTAEDSSRQGQSTSSHAAQDCSPAGGAEKQGHGGDPMTGVTFRDEAVNHSAEASKDTISQQPFCQAQQVSPKAGGAYSDAPALLNMVFGPIPSPQTLSQWTNQGFRFSEDPETSLGLVQREGGPCGVLAPIQALVLKHLLFSDSAAGHASGSDNEALAFTPEQSQRALVSAMAETLWLAGEGTRAALALLNADTAPILECLGSAETLAGVLKVHEYQSLEALKSGILHSMPLFQSGVGALLMLFSALLSRTLAQTQADRDDPGLPLVTEPFGHASQEIVNLLLCGRAVPNVFDGVMDLGGGMSLKGIPSQTDVGFLTLLESLNLCKVGDCLKRPRLPIWVVGSESHYTVLFALSRDVQQEDSVEEREEKRVREAFDRLDASGGGGFITPEALETLSAELGFELPSAVKEEIGGGMGVIVWQELWKALLNLETSKGGLKHIADAAAQSGAAPQQRRFHLFHFNGIAKRVLASAHTEGTLSAATNGDQTEITRNVVKPRLTKMWVNVPPKWTPNECMAIQPYTVSDLNLSMASAGEATPLPALNHPADVSGTSVAWDVCESTLDTSLFDRVQHAPLADCIRTRWPRATCGWDGDAPSIV